MTSGKFLKRSVYLWIAFIFVDVILFEVSDVVHNEGWHVALERFGITVAAGLPVSVAMIYRFSLLTSRRHKP